MAGKCPQESYDAVFHAVKLEWIFLKLLTKDTGQAFAGVGKVLRETSLPRLFFGK